MRPKLVWILAIFLVLLSACGSPDTGQSGQGYDLTDPLLPGDAYSDGEGADDVFSADAESEDIQREDADAGIAAPDVIPDYSDQVGEPCADDADCALGRCLVDDGFVDGYCTTPNACEFDDQCPEGSTCMRDAETSFCARRCDAEGACREGYTCQDSPASPFDGCAPAPQQVETGVDGAACTRDEDCGGGYCLLEPDWPGGYCTTPYCESREDCARGTAGSEVDNRCLIQQGQVNFCVRMCQNTEDCREDYVCQRLGGNQGFCSPDPTADIGLDDVEDYPFPITCGLSAQNDRISIDYEISPDTTSYMLTPLARDGRSLMPTRLVLPDATEVSFRGANNFQTIPAYLFGYLNPIITPALDALAAQLQSGAHTLELRTNSEDLCYYLLEESTPGSRIDFNIYLVGVGLTAAEAENDPNMQAVLAQFDAVYAQAGIEIGTVNFREITGPDAQAYQIVRSDMDVQELVALSTLPEGGYDAALSANIFFVRSMQLDESGSAIGISQGLPGTAALHGTPSSGVVFTSEYIGQQFRDRAGEVIDGNEFTGIVMAHEVGHYLGLFHTSEQYGQGFDPIGDTPECRNSRGFPQNCPDLNNLMFPLAGISHTELSAGQLHVIKANPLTKD